MNSKEHRLMDWFAHGQVGLSSKAMASVALGVDCAERSNPSDPADLNRCLLLLERVPEVRASVPAIAKLSPQWAALIAKWDEVANLFLEEVGINWSKAKSAPKTYALMKKLLNEASK